MRRSIPAVGRTEDAGWRSSRLWTALLAVGLGASFLMMRFSNLFWTYLPKLRFVQFPWRWMSVVALVYVCFLAAAVEKRRGWLAVVLLSALSVPLAVFLVNNGWWDPDEMPTQQAAITSKAGFDGTDEYDPLGDDHMDLSANAPEVKVMAEGEDSAPTKDVAIKLLSWNTEHKEVAVDAGENARLAMRVLNYPAWRVTVNGQVVQPERMDDINQMVIPVERGKSIIEIRFARTVDRVIGDVVSLVSLGIVGLLCFWRKTETAERILE